MKNFSHEGRTMTVLAPSALVSGQGFFLGATFLVAVKNALIGQPVACYRLGCFRFAAVPADAWAQGDRLYWVTEGIYAGMLTDSVATSVLVGVADATKLATETSALVCLTGQVVEDLG